MRNETRYAHRTHAQGRTERLLRRCQVRRCTRLVPLSRREAALHESVRGSGHEVVGREAELAVLRAFLERDGGVRTLVVTGDAGIGKTTLWDAGLGAAREQGFRVLSTRASSAEAKLSYAALIDLLDGVDTEELAQLPAPQLHALEVALLRREPAGAPADSQAIALGFLNALRALPERPLLVAVDDFPWLDAPSAEALTFAARRLEDDAIVFLLSRRPGRPSTLEQALGAGQLDRLEVGPLSYGAIRRLLSERLGLTLPRHLLRRLVDSTLGNPLFAMELGRELSNVGCRESVRTCRCLMRSRSCLGRGWPGFRPRHAGCCSPPRSVQT